MYPRYWHSMHRFGPWHRGPSRILWFAFGAFSATLWAAHRDKYLQSRTYGHCFRVPHQFQPPVTQQRSIPPYDTNFNQNSNTANNSTISNGRGDGVSESDDKSQDIASMLKSISQTINNLPTHTEGDGMPRTFGQRVQEEKWEEEKERMLELGRQAGDTMADISEATLDSVLSTVEALKSKLTMHRIQREEQRKRLEQQMEEEKKKPLRWV